MILTLLIVPQKTIPKGPYWENDTELRLDHLGEKCPQKSMVGGGKGGKEDCLSLNVYTPFVSLAQYFIY